MPSDTLTGVVVNETFVKRMNWAEPIGKKVDVGQCCGWQSDRCNEGLSSDRYV